MSDLPDVPDLDRIPYSEALRRTLYDAVRRIQLPEHSEPILFYAWGRWFAVWEAYRELLDGAWEHMDGGALWGFVARFLSRPLTALEPGGLVRVPEEAFPLAEGSAVRLCVSRRSLQVFVE